MSEEKQFEIEQILFHSPDRIVHNGHMISEITPLEEPKQGDNSLISYQN